MRDGQNSRKESVSRERGEYSEAMDLRLLAPTYYSRYTEVLKMIEKVGLVLDLGCADGLYSQAISNRNNEVVGIDINIDFLHKERQSNSLSFLVANGKELPFKDETFNAILCVDVIDHVSNDEQVLSEIYRVLKPNGQLVISIPNRNFPFTYDPINFVLGKINRRMPIGIWGFGHKRIYSFEHVTSLLKKYRFNIVQTRYLTHDLAACFENYLSTIFQWVGVREKKKSHRIGTVSHARRFIYEYAHHITKLLASVDTRLFNDISRSVGIVISAQRLTRH